MPYEKWGGPPQDEDEWNQFLGKTISDPRIMALKTERDLLMAENMRLREVMKPLVKNNFQTGTCNYTVKWKVYTRTSGTELQGPEVFYDEFESESDAIYALVNDVQYMFTRSKWSDSVWRSKDYYTQAYIKRVVEYDFT